MTIIIIIIIIMWQPTIIYDTHRPVSYYTIARSIERDNNNNNNTQDDIYSAVIISTTSLQEFIRLIWWM